MKAPGWIGAGSVLTAAASSACCWLPLLMVATGFSAVGASAFFEEFRGVFLAGAGTLLAIGFYLTYRRVPVPCDGEGPCETRSAGKRVTRATLWISAALVAGFAFFPQYVGSLVGAAGETRASSATAPSDRWTLSIEGMTCAGCEAGVETALGSLAGVRGVEASHESGVAVLEVEPGQAPGRMSFAAAIGEAGYRLGSVVATASATPGAAPASTAPAAGGRPEPTEWTALAGQWSAELPVKNGTAKLVVDIGRLGERWVGEFDLLGYVEDYPVEVSFSGRNAKLFLTAIGMDFEGALSADRGTLSGTGRSGDETETIVLRRSSSEPRFSEGFLELEAAADDPSRVRMLAPNGAELRERFQADRGKTRLLMLLSPT